MFLMMSFILFSPIPVSYTHLLPGETVQISGGRILIDGEVYNEGKDFPMITNPGLAATAVTLESGEYFVLGDNRNNSEEDVYKRQANARI